MEESRSKLIFINVTRRVLIIFDQGKLKEGLIFELKFREGGIIINLRPKFMGREGDPIWEGDNKKLNFFCAMRPTLPSKSTLFYVRFLFTPINNPKLAGFLNP